MDEIDVSTFTNSREVVDLPSSPLAEHSFQSEACILDVQPVSSLLSAAVDWDGFPAQEAADCFGNEFFRQLVRPILIGGASNEHRKSVGVVVGLAEQIRCSFADRIRGCGPERARLREGALMSQGPVYLVSRDVEKDHFRSSWLTAADPFCPV